MSITKSINLALLEVINSLHTNSIATDDDLEVTWDEFREKWREAEGKINDYIMKIERESIENDLGRVDHEEELKESQE
jgi:hypothetical protein